MIDLLGAGNPYMAQGFAEGGEAANSPPPVRQRPEAYIQMTPGMTQPEYAELSRQEGLRLMRGEEARTLADMLYAPKKAASDAFWNEKVQKEQQRLNEANRQLAFYGRDTVSPDELRGTPEYDRVNSYVDEYLERVKRDYWNTTGRNVSQKLLSDANILRNIPEPWATPYQAVKLSDGSTFIYDTTGKMFNTREDAERIANQYEQRAENYRQISDNIAIQNLYNQYGISPTEKDSAQKFRDALFSTAGWQLTKAAEMPKYEYERKNAARELEYEKGNALMASQQMEKFGRQQIQNALFQSYNPQELQSEIERIQREGVPQNWWGEDLHFSNARYTFEPTFRPPTAQATTPTAPTTPAPQAPGAVAPTSPTTPAPVLPQPGQQAPVMPGGMQPTTPTTPGGTSPTAPGGTTPTAPAPAPIQYLSPTAQPPIGGIPQPFQFLPRTVVPYTPAQYESMFPGYTGTTQQASQPLQQQQPQMQIQYGPIGQAAVQQPSLLDTLLRPQGQQDQTAVSLLGANNPYLMKPFG